MDAEERKAELMSQNKMSDGRMFKLDFDPRVIGNKILPDGTRKTGIGEFIRKTSLDEFPQFWNVLNGSMSLVGTRPILQDELRQYELHHRARIAIKPGITAHVLAMEQIMSTGGGWQDQVGGITSGLKYITSMPGLQQQLQVAHIELSPQTKKELDERFVLIYTGQRRLARNLLRDVVGRYVGNEPDSLFALEEIQKTAALMRFELERGNVDGFAKLLDYHWELSKKIDAGSSNTLIEQIFSSIEELVDGKLVCGAGGGGFLQVILKKGVTKQMVEERLKAGTVG